MAMVIRLVSILLAVILMIPAGISFAGVETDRSGSTKVLTGVSELEYLREEPEDMTGIWLNFLDTKNTAYGYEFPYSDSFFRSGSDKFSIWNARGSLALALSAFRSSTGVADPEYKTYLKGAGFRNLYAFGYDKPTEKDSLSGVIGMKEIDGFTVIAAVTCGQGYGAEWAGNLTVGDSERHEGFSTAAEKLESYIAQYIEENSIQGRKKLWLNGMSRAGAIANLTAADAVESGEYEDVYAYLFGVPRTTKAPIAYSGIYNICGQYDPVAQTPFQSWGYERYGIDLYTPAQESDADYPEHAKAASKVGDQFAADGFRNNPEVNYQLHMVMETLDELFSSSKDYSERFQPLIIKAMEGHDESGMVDILIDAAKNVVPKDPRERTELTEFIDYLSYMAGQHMRADQRQVRDGSWDPDEPLEANLVIEHRPVTYVKWLFADIEPEELFSTGNETRRITFLGDTGIVVRKDGVAISGIDSRGTVLVPDGGEDAAAKGAKGVFLMRNGSQTVLNLPADEDYEIMIEQDADGTLTVFDITVSPQLLQSRPGKMYIGRVKSGLYRMNVSANSSPDKPEAAGKDEKSPRFTAREFNYSPAAVMGDELAATNTTFFSLSGFIAYGTLVMSGLGVFLALCMLIHIYHRFRIRRGHKPYSDWYVIVPHLIFIAVFAVLTQYATFYMFTIGKLRAQCAAATIFAIFLLSFRGALKSKRPSAMLVSVILLLLVPLAGTYYNNLPIDSFSTVNMIVYFAMTALLSALAVRSFRTEKSSDAVPQS